MYLCIVLHQPDSGVLSAASKELQPQTLWWACVSSSSSCASAASAAGAAAAGERDTTEGRQRLLKLPTHSGLLQGRTANHKGSPDANIGIYIYI